MVSRSEIIFTKCKKKFFQTKVNPPRKVKEDKEKLVAIQKKKTKTVHEIFLLIQDAYEDGGYDHLNDKFLDLSCNYVRWSCESDCGAFCNPIGQGNIYHMYVLPNGYNNKNTQSWNQQYNSIKLLTVKESICHHEVEDCLWLELFLKGL